eukprot:scaffold49982_cov36-Tisochrysis_lutea.AAC.5
MVGVTVLHDGRRGARESERRSGKGLGHENKKHLNILGYHLLQTWYPLPPYSHGPYITLLPLIPLVRALWSTIDAIVGK